MKTHMHVHVCIYVSHLPVFCIHTYTLIPTHRMPLIFLMNVCFRVLFVWVIPVHENMQINTVTHFRTFIAFLIVKYLFLF
jgi:hypothetical protein